MKKMIQTILLALALSAPAQAQERLEPFAVTTKQIGDAQGQLYKRATCNDFLTAFTRASTYNADGSDTVGGEEDTLTVLAFSGFAAGYAHARDLTIQEGMLLLFQRCQQDPDALFAGMQ